ISNNLEWAPNSICDLYKARWAIEVFFKEIKQTLQFADFMGYNKNAARWQIWTALLTYILLRFIAWQSKWNHSFTRLFTVLRDLLWSCLDMFSVLERCGTAGDIPRIRSAGKYLYPGGNSPGMAGAGRKLNLCPENR
ncbi:MAG: transposase, partial [Victivallales bacterium]|nr:transposase [Victivallales bacterium]